MTQMTPIAAALMIALGLGTHLSAHARDPLDRTVLPIAEPERPVNRELDARNVQPPPHFEVKAVPCQAALWSLALLKRSSGARKSANVF